MAQVDKARVNSINYDIAQSPDATFTGTSSDVADGSATSWTSVPKLDNTSTNSTIFEKISKMFKNIRYLYKLIGTTDISTVGDGTLTNGLINHTHSVSALPVSNQQSNSTTTVPTSALVYSMNQTLTTLNNIKVGYGTTDPGVGSSLTSGKLYCVYEA